MNWDTNRDYVDKLAACVASYDEPAAAAICDELIAALKQADTPFPVENAGRILATLRRNRYFELISRVAEALISNGQDDARVLRQYAQALIDSDKVSIAIALLEKLVAETIGQPDEQREAKGLLGRAFKQRYVDAGNSRSARARRDLLLALKWYYDVYRSDKTQYWHGINGVALLMRAAQDEVTFKDIDDAAATAREIAAHILRRIEDRWYAGEASMWDCATAAEACVALDRTEAAGTWIQRYVAQPAINAFEITSTLRQFREVWQLDSSVEPGLSLLTVLQAELLKHQGGCLQIEAADLASAAVPGRAQYFEKVLGNTRYMSCKDLRKAFERARCVARIEDHAGYGVGTGFLIRGGALHPALGDELVILTNAHVISDDKKVITPSPLLLHEAVITFQVLREEGIVQEDHEFAELLWTSPPSLLDATLLRLSGPVENIEPYPVAPRLPLADGRQRVYIIGHPKGGPLSFSIQDNFLLDHEGPPAGSPLQEDVVRLHYRAPTEGGSSGSPVFNQQWKLIGLHHAGGTEMPKLNRQQGFHPANEGIWIQSIIGAMAKDPQRIGADG